MIRARFYGILDLGYIKEHQVRDMTAAMLAGGVEIIQIRAKHELPQVISRIAHAVHPLTSAAGVPLIINDHPELLRDTPAEGVHVGQDDASVVSAREQAGRPVLVGKSTHSLEQARAAFDEAPDYIGFGPLHATPTKPDYAPVGLDDIARVHAVAPVPVFCIGGVNLQTIDAVMDAGAQRVVVVSAILQSSDPQAYCRSIHDHIRRREG